MALLDCDLTVCHVPNLLTPDVATAKTAHGRSMTARGQRRRGQQNTNAAVSRSDASDRAVPADQAR
jgi:hypothetical protein